MRWVLRVAGEEFLIAFFGGISTLIWADLAIRRLDKAKKPQS